MNAPLFRSCCMYIVALLKAAESSTAWALALLVCFILLPHHHWVRKVTVCRDAYSHKQVAVVVTPQQSGDTQHNGAFRPA